MKDRAGIGALLAWIALTAAAASLGALASVSAADFYGRLARPEWAPPAAVFGPVWTVLYAMMAVAIWLAHRSADASVRPRVVALYVAQLAANALWSWLFFRWHLGAWAFAEVLLLLALVVATAMAFHRARPIAGWLLAPYAAWVAFASALTFAVWQRNPGLL